MLLLRFLFKPLSLLVCIFEACMAPRVQSVVCTEITELYSNLALNVCRNPHRNWKDEQAQPNMAYDSLQLGNQAPACNQSKSGGAAGKNGSDVTVGEAGGRSENTLLAVLGIGLLLLACNIWFWFCFVVRKRSIICCMTNEIDRKVLAEEAELSTPAKPDHNYNPRRVQGESVWYDNSDNLSKTDSFSQGSRFGVDDQAISLISNGHVSRSSHQLELYGCNRSSKTLPRRGCTKSSHEQYTCTELARAASQEHLKAADPQPAMSSDQLGKTGSRSDFVDHKLIPDHPQTPHHGADHAHSAGHDYSHSSRSSHPDQQGGSHPRVKIVEPHPRPSDHAAHSRPKLTTFCHSEGGAVLEGGEGRTHYTVQTVQRADGADRFLNPESV